MVRIPEQKYDAVFPQLNHVIQPAYMLELFRQELEQEGLCRIQHVRLERFLYKPGKKCRLIYRVEVSKASHGGTSPHLLVCDLIPQGEALPGPAPSWFREVDCLPARLVVAQEQLVCHTFPNDAGLPQLTRLTRPDFLTRLVAELPEFAGGPPRQVRSEMVKYVPENRLVLRLTVREGEGQPERNYYLKTSGSSLTPIFRGMQAIFRNWQQSGYPVRVPEPLHYHAETNSMLMRAVPGVKLTKHLEKVSPEHLGESAAELLSLIHTCSCADFPRRNPAEEQKDVHKALEIIHSYDRELGSRVSQLMDSLLRVSLPEPERMTPTHGAFRATQMLLDGNTIGLVDFDGLQLGNPWNDVASFIAHLFYLYVKQEVDFTTAERMIRRFLQTYFRCTGFRADPLRLKHLTAVELIKKHGKKMIKRAKSGGQEKLVRMTELAEKIWRSGMLDTVL
jgi:aminoglycoside phosphotransferase (APT) family kinase protein